MKKYIYWVLGILVLFSVPWSILPTHHDKKKVIIDESGSGESIIQTIQIDKAWDAFPTGNWLFTHNNRQYIAFYNAQCHLVVGQRNLSDEKFSLKDMTLNPEGSSEDKSLVTESKDQISVKLGIDREGYIHLAEFKAGDPLRYFRSSLPDDISTLGLDPEMTGNDAKNCAEGGFISTREGDLIFHCRSEINGTENEIFKSYSCETKKWSELLSTPLTSEDGNMNSLFSLPVLSDDNWFHIYWVWYQNSDVSSCNDLSCIKSPDLKRWFNGSGEIVTLPISMADKSVVVEPGPVLGEMPCIPAKLCLDINKKPLLAYPKIDPKGRIQLYVSRQVGKRWVSLQITGWDYKKEIRGEHKNKNEVMIKDFRRRADTFYEVSYRNDELGNGTVLLDEKLDNIGSVLKPKSFIESLIREDNIPGSVIQTLDDQGKPDGDNIRYVLKWEALPENSPAGNTVTTASNIILVKVTGAGRL